MQLQLNNVDGVFAILRVVAKRYKELTGRKIVNITGDLGEYLTCYLLHWNLAEEQQAG